LAVIRARCVARLTTNIHPPPGTFRELDRAADRAQVIGRGAHRDHHQVDERHNLGDGLGARRRRVDQQDAVSGGFRRFDGSLQPVRRVDPARRLGLTCVPPAGQTALRVSVHDRDRTDVGCLGRDGEVRRERRLARSALAGGDPDDTHGRMKARG